MSEGRVEVTVRVAVEDGDRVIKLIRAASFRDVRAFDSRRTRAGETLTITALRVGITDLERERARIGAVEVALTELGISFEWATHGTGARSISSEWLSVVFVGTQAPTGFKINVVNRFEVAQELARVAELVRRRPADLTVFPHPPWLRD